MATQQELVSKIIAKLPEEGAVNQEQVLTWWRWHEHLLNILEAMGYHYRGESVKDQGWSSLLVLKVAKEGIPLVAFVTERTTTDCMRVCLKQLDEDRVPWREDKFARN